jgi:hypothetical protein
MTAKVYGLQRSGNNWLMWTLAANYKCEVLGKSAGWTHGQMNVVQIYGKEPDAIFIIVRHPLAWLPSMWRYACKDGIEFEEYVRKDNAIDRWNDSYSSWLVQASSFKTAKVFIARYEDLLLDTESKLDIMCARAGIDRKKEFFAHAVGKMGLHMNQTDGQFDPTYYTQRRFMNAYSPELVAHVRSRVDGDLAHRLGYREVWK